MIEQDLPAEDIIPSTDFDPGAMLEQDSPPLEIEGMAEFLADLSPEEDSPVAEESTIGASEEDEHEASDNNSTDEEGEADDDQQEEAESLVDWNEMQEHQFEIDGKVYSASDLKAAISRQAGSQNAQKEVENAQAALQQREDRIQEMERLASQNLTFIQAETTIASQRQRIDQIRQAQENAAKNGDTNLWQKLEMDIRQIDHWIQDESQKLEEAKYQHAGQQAEMQSKILEARGMGDVLKDSQYIATLAKYVESIHPSVVDLVDNNAFIFELAMKAQKYDKAQESGKKRKLKGSSKKTLRGGAGGPKAKSNRALTPDQLIENQIEEMFKV